MPPVRPLPPGRPKRTLVARLGRVADRVRQVATNLGARPLRVFLVWTQAGGYERGEGEEEEIARAEILPTPVVSDLSALALSPFAAGKYPVGTVRVSEVSMHRFTRDVLTGRRVPRAVAEKGREAVRTGELDAFFSPASGEPIPKERVSFFYEVVDDGRFDDRRPSRQRFRLFGEPHPNAENVEWILFLERTSEDRSRDEQSQEGVDADQAESDL